MGDIAEKWFRGYELGALGLVTPEVSGVFGVADIEVAETVVPGRDVPSLTTVRRKIVPMTFKCVVAADTHEELVRKLVALEGILDPDLLYQEFRIESRPEERTFARVVSLPVNMGSLPYLTTVAEFSLAMERYPWWEDADEQTLTLTGATLTGDASNSGTKTAYPVYTCTITDALASGLAITVGGQSFVYTGALAAGDTLIVTTGQELPDVTLNGTRAWGDTDPSSAYPTLPVGDTTITKSSAGFDLTVAWRRRRD